MISKYRWGSYWYSDIENKNFCRWYENTWALFNRINYKNLNVVLTGGRQSISNKDALSPASSTFGSFDGEYDIANKGYFYTVDTSYVLRMLKIRSMLRRMLFLVVLTRKKMDLMTLSATLLEWRGTIKIFLYIPNM